MGKLTVIYRDQYGNTLCHRYIKTRSAHQYTARNSSGHILDKESLDIMKRRARSAGKKLIEPKGPVIREWKNKMGNSYSIQKR